MGTLRVLRSFVMYCRRPLECQVAKPDISKMVYYYDPDDYELKKGWFPFRNNHFVVNSEKVSGSSGVREHTSCEVAANNRPSAGVHSQLLDGDYLSLMLPILLPQAKRLLGWSPKHTITGDLAEYFEGYKAAGKMEAEPDFQKVRRCYSLFRSHAGLDLAIEQLSAGTRSPSFAW